MKKRVSLLTLGLMLALTGCASESVVEGKVTMKGTAVSEAMVMFQTDDGNTIGQGTTDGLGVFKLKSTQGKDKIPNGTYKVVVTKRKAAEAPMGSDPTDMMKAMKGAKIGKNELPDKYGNLKTTTLTATVPSKSPLEFNLE